MTYLVFIAICAAGLAPSRCDRSTATDWIAAPEPQIGLGACLVHGQQHRQEQCGVRR